MNPFGDWMDAMKLSEQLYKALQWPPAIYNSRTFPFAVAAINYGVTVDEDDGNAPTCVIDVVLRFKDGEELHILDRATEYPSEILLAQLNLLAGETSHWRAAHRRAVAERVEKDRTRSKYSNRPW